MKNLLLYLQKGSGLLVAICFAPPILFELPAITSSASQQVQQLPNNNPFTSETCFPYSLQHQPLYNTAPLSLGPLTTDTCYPYVPEDSDTTLPNNKNPLKLSRRTLTAGYVISRPYPLITLCAV